MKSVAIILAICAAIAYGNPFNEKDFHIKYS